MRKEAKMLLDKSCDSLLLGIEVFNRPQDRGRVSSVLIHIDHSFEMFLKAAIVHRGGQIRDKNARETIGFDACVRRGLSDGSIKFLTETQALTLQTINGFRDAAQHYLLDISEGQFYVHIQSAVTLFKDLLQVVFQKDLSDELPERVLPISTSPPTNIATIFDSEIKEIVKLLQPGKRRRIDAEARLRPLVILDSAVKGERRQPSSQELGRTGRDLLTKNWDEVFTGVSAIEITAEGYGPTLSIRLTKSDGPPVQIVPEGTTGAYPVAVRRVNELGFYSLGASNLADKFGITVPKLLAVVKFLDMRNDIECYKEFWIGSSCHKRYSQKAIGKIKEALEKESIEEIWEKHKAGSKRGSAF